MRVQLDVMICRYIEECMSEEKRKGTVSEKILDSPSLAVKGKSSVGNREFVRELYLFYSLATNSSM